MLKFGSNTIQHVALVCINSGDEDCTCNKESREYVIVLTSGFSVDVRNMLG